MKYLIVALTLCLVFCNQLSADSSGTIGGGLGATMPQGEFNEYTKTGFSIMGFGKINPFDIPWAGLRLGLQLVLFENEGRVVFFEGFPYDEIYTNNLIKGTLGLEVSKRFFAFEPYGGAGIGIYYFRTETEVKNSAGEVLISQVIDSKTKFGWNLNCGIKIALFPKIAFDFNLQYDIVKNLEQYKNPEGDENPDNLERVSFNSGFLSLFAGISIPFELF